MLLETRSEEDEEMMTEALCSNNASAMPKPMPEVPPMTRTPASLSLDVYLEGVGEAIESGYKRREERGLVELGKKWNEEVRKAVMIYRLNSHILFVDLDCKYDVHPTFSSEIPDTVWILP